MQIPKLHSYLSYGNFCSYMGRAAAPPQVSDSSKSAELTTSAAKSASRVPQISPKFPPEPLPKAELEKSASDEAEQCNSE